MTDVQSQMDQRSTVNDIVLNEMSPIFIRAACCFFNMKQGDNDTLLNEICVLLHQLCTVEWKSFIPNIDIGCHSTLLDRIAERYRIAERHNIDERHNTHPTQFSSINHCNPDSGSVVPILSTFLLKIGIVGEIGHGKSTIASHLCKAHGCSEYSFAKPLKDGVMVLFNLTPDQVYTEQKDQVDPWWNVSPRYLLQKLGTEFFREQLTRKLSNFHLTSSSLWIYNFLKWDTEHKLAHTVVSDCRFVNEADALRSRGYKLLRVVRNGAQSGPLQTEHRHGLICDKQQKIESQQPCGRTVSNVGHWPPSTHLSEREQSGIDVDFVIMNNGTVDDLCNLVDEIIVDKLMRS